MAGPPTAGSGDVCLELERQLFDLDQQIKSGKVHLEKLESALGYSKDASKAYKDRIDLLKLLLQSGGSVRSHANTLGEIAATNQQLSANEQQIGSITSQIASVRSQLSLREKEIRDKSRDYDAKCGGGNLPGQKR